MFREKLVNMIDLEQSLSKEEKASVQEEHNLVQALDPEVFKFENGWVSEMPSVAEYIEEKGDPRKIRKQNKKLEKKGELEAMRDKLRRLLDDVSTTKKAMADMPLDAVVYTLGVKDLNEFAKTFAGKGLKYGFHFNVEPGLEYHPGILAIWDEKKLQAILDKEENQKILKKRGLPITADGFAAYVGETWVQDLDVLRVVQQAYGD